MSLKYERIHSLESVDYENEIHQQQYKDGTSIEDHFNSLRLLVAQCRAVGGTMSDVSVALAMHYYYSNSVKLSV